MAAKQPHWRTAIWARINDAFSAAAIDETAQSYRSYLRRSSTKTPNFVANFVDFVMDAGILSEVDDAQWRQGLKNFAPGTFEVVSHVVHLNLGGGREMYRSIDRSVNAPQGDDPLPMFFERIFEDKEFVTIRPTKIGIKVTLATTEEGFEADGTRDQWKSWSKMLAKRRGQVASVKKKKKVKKKSKRKSKKKS